MEILLSPYSKFGIEALHWTRNFFFGTKTLGDWFSNRKIIQKKIFFLRHIIMPKMQYPPPTLLPLPECQYGLHYMHCGGFFFRPRSPFCCSFFIPPSFFFKKKLPFGIKIVLGKKTGRKTFSFFFGFFFEGLFLFFHKKQEQSIVSGTGGTQHITLYIIYLQNLSFCHVPVK